MKNLLGVDSKRFVNGKFQALIGVGLTVKDSNLGAFTKTYNEFMDSLFKSGGLDRRRPIYKSYDLKSLFYTQGKEPIKEFVEATKDKVDYLDFFYSYFTRKIDENGNPEKPPEFIDIYYGEPTGGQKVNAIKFLNIIEPAYAAICSWGCIKENELLSSNMVFFVDHFQANPSKMWEQLSNMENFHVVYSGGKCNYLISAADLYLAHIEEQIKKNNIRLNRQVHKILHDNLKFTGKFTSHFLADRDLYQLSPATKSNIRLNSKLKHPIFYVFTEGNEAFEKIFGSKNEQSFLEQSPFVDKVFKLATESNGSVKFYEVSQDNSFITKEDKFYFYGENGKSKVETLKRAGFNNETFSAENL